MVMTSVAMTVPKLSQPMARFNWQKTTHEFGRIPQGKPVTAEFLFFNKGDVPLLVKNARGSCGCTGVEYPKEAILPGQAGTIKATFNAATPGTFNKTITVESNAEESVQTLNFKGEVVPSNLAAQ